MGNRETEYYINKNGRVPVWVEEQQKRQNEIDDLIQELKLIGTKEADDVRHLLELIRLKPKGMQHKLWIKARLQTMGNGYLIVRKAERKGR